MTRPRIRTPRLLAAEATSRELSILRAATFGIWALLILRLPVTNFQHVPEEMLRLRGWYAWLPLHDLFQHVGLMRALQVAAVAGCLTCVLGVRPWRWLAVPTATLIIFFDASTKSVGSFANHAQVAVLYMALLLALLPHAGDRLGTRRSRTSEATAGSPAVYARFALLTGGLALAVAYALIGTRRLVGGGAELFAGDSMLIWLVARSLKDSAYGFTLGLGAVDSRLLLQVVGIGFLVTTIAEVLSPLALFDSPFRKVWLATIIPFHFTTLATMNIFFWENLVLLAILFTRLPTTGARVLHLPVLGVRWPLLRHRRTGT